MRLWLAVSGIALSVAVHAQTTELDRFVGRDLWKDKDNRRALAERIGKVAKGEIVEPTPWHVWKSDRNGQTRYIVRLVESEMIVPGGSTAWVAPDETTVDEWAGMLASENRVAALAALTFLGGRHLVEPGRNLLPEPKESKCASLFQQLVGDPRIHNLIDQLNQI